MKFNFDALQKSGKFSEEFMNKLAEDCSYIEKTALGPYMSALLPSLGVALGSAAIAGTYGYLAAKRHYEKHHEGLSKSYDTMMSTHKEFSDSPDKFHQRFSELSIISPTVAANPNLAHKIIKPRLDTGFDLDDVHRLAAIQYHVSTSPRIEEPSTKARAAAADAFGTFAGQLIPAAFNQGHLNKMQIDAHRSQRDAAAAASAEQLKVQKNLLEEVNSLRKDYASFGNRGQQLGGTPTQAAEQQATQKALLEGVNELRRAHAESEKRVLQQGALPTHTSEQAQKGAKMMLALGKIMAQRGMSQQEISETLSNTEKRNAFIASVRKDVGRL